MSTDQWINVLVSIALIELMVAIGLGVATGEVIRVAANWRLVVRAAVANYVCVPAIAIGLLVLFGTAPLVAAGFLMAAVCPGAPYGPPFTALAKGNTTISVGLMVILAGSSAFAAPLLLYLLLPLVSGGQSLDVDAGKVVVTLLATQFLPLGAGLALREWRPNWAARLLKPARLLSIILNIAVIGLILVVHFQTLTDIRPRGFVGMLALVVAALLVGGLLGMPGGGQRRAMAIATSVRNVGVGLVIATSSFPGTPAVTAALAFGLFQTIVVALIALGWGRWPPAAAGRP